MERTRDPLTIRHLAGIGAAIALALSVGCGSDDTPAAPVLKRTTEPVGAAASAISLDASSYAFGASVPVRLTFKNSGQGTVWLRRTCETFDYPAAQLVRPAGDTTPIFVGWGSTLCSSSAPYPEPIRVAPQETISWVWTIRNSLPNQLSSAPDSWFTGDFKIVLLIQNSTRIVDAAGDEIPLDLRTSPQFRIAP